MKPYEIADFKKRRESVAGSSKKLILTSVGAIIAGLAAIVMIRFLPFLMEDLVNNAQEHPQDPEKMILEHEYAIAQDAIKLRLLSPASAVFCPLDQVIIQEDVQPMTDKWMGWVEATDRYGANARYYWTVAKLNDSEYDPRKKEIVSYATFIFEKIEEAKK